MEAKALDNRQFSEDCTPGYFNNEGNLSSPGPYGQSYGGGAVEYFAIIRKWRESQEWERDTTTRYATVASSKSI